MKIPGSKLNEMFKEDLRRVKELIPRTLKEAAQTQAMQLNGVLSTIRPSSVSKIEVASTPSGFVAQDDINPIKLPGRLFEVAMAISPVIYSTDNVYREAYSAAKRLGIDSGLVRENLKQVFEVATYEFQVRAKQDKNLEATATTVANNANKDLGKIFER